MKKICWLASGFLGLAAFSPALGADITVSSGQSVSAALATATAGDRVLVEAGSYYESVALVDGVELRGGYDASFSEGTRDPLANVTMIHGSEVSPAVTSGPGVGSSTVVDGFLLSGGGGTPGACVLVDGGAPVFSNNSISGNHHTGIAGAVYIFGGSSARFADNLISDNSSVGSGGGMRVEHSSPEIVRNTFDGCLAPSHGGGLYAVQTAMACSSNVFRDCRSRDGGGGGVYLQNCGDDAVFVDTVFENCDGPFGGGLLIKDECSPQLQRTLFDGCSASRSGGGAAIFGCDFFGPTFNGAVFLDCTAEQSGGGLYADGSIVHLLGSDPTTDSETDRSLVTFARCLSGEGQSGSGGGLATSKCVGTVELARFMDCRSDSMGGGMYLFRSEMIVTQCIVENCVAGSGGGIALHTNAASSLLSPQSLVQNCTINACEATDGAGRPGGGMTVAAIGSLDIALIAGNIVTNVVDGAGIRCVRGSSASGTGRPTIHCSSFHADPGNGDTVIDGNNCSDSFSSGVSNFASDITGYEPEYCDAIPVDYSIKACGLDAGTNCIYAVEELDHRGANQITCSDPCDLVSIESASWGEIKALYR
jgi:hypothetical protein